MVYIYIYIYRMVIGILNLALSNMKSGNVQYPETKNNDLKNPLKHGHNAISFSNCTSSSLCKKHTYDYLCTVFEQRQPSASSCTKHSEWAAKAVSALALATAKLSIWGTSDWWGNHGEWDNTSFKTSFLLVLALHMNTSVFWTWLGAVQLRSLNLAPSFSNRVTPLGQSPCPSRSQQQIRRPPGPGQAPTGGAGEVRHREPVMVDRGWATRIING